MVSAQLAVLLLTAAANFALGGIVWLKAPSQRPNRYFGVFSATVAVWTASAALAADAALNHGGTTSPVMWARSAFVAAALIPLTFLLFVHVFPARNARFSRAGLFVFGLIGVAIGVLAFTPLIVRSTTTVNGVLQVGYGPLHRVFGAYFVSCFAYALVVLARQLRSRRGIENLQVRWILVGVGVAGLGATITNLLVPLAVHSSRFSAYGPVFSVLMMAVIAHTIVRYRLMDIRLVISRGVAYLLAVIVSGGALAALIEATSFLFAYRPLHLPLRWELALILPIAVLFQPVSRFFRYAFDKYFYRSPYDYERTIRDVSQKIGTMLDLRSLLDYICDVVGRTVQPEHVSIYLASPELSADYQLMAHRSFLSIPSASVPSSAPASSALSQYFSVEPGPLLKEDAVRFRQHLLKAELDEVSRLGGECIYPIVDNGQPTGFVVLGRKLSGDPYFAEDLSLLTTLITQAAVAIKNAHLHRQVVLVNEYIEHILAAMDSGVVAVAADGAVTLFNASAERLTGLEADRIKTKPLNNLPAPLGQALHHTLVTGQAQLQREFFLVGANQKSCPVVCSTSTLTGQSATVLGAVAVLSDLSRLKELEGEKLRAERLASVGALASSMAHEIKNPLVAIRTFAELLPERFAQADFREDFAKVVVQEIQRIDGLASRLLGMASPRSQRWQAVNLRDPISDTLALLRWRFEHAGIAVKLDCELERPIVAGDADQLKQLFLNLFVNAIEAMERGGLLTVHLAQWDSGQATLLIVEVSDTGSGIQESVVGSLFEPFVTTKEDGSGLGLSICRGIVEAHGATIHARNNADGVGATVAVEFPRWGGDASSDGRT